MGAVLICAVQLHSGNGRLAEIVTELAERFGSDALPAAPASLADRLRAVTNLMAARLDDMEHRSLQAHSITALPTREPLFEALGQAPEGGTLAVIELGNFDRLMAFDIDLADAVIKETARRISRMLSADRLLAQVDRARFAIWLRGESVQAAESEIAVICYALRSRIETPSANILPQIDFACVSRDDDAPASVLSRALGKLSCPSLARQPGGDRDIVHYARDDFQLEQDLREAAANNQLELWYQPFVNASAQSVCGAEALLRWRHPDRGLIGPAHFIPLMETAGLAEEIGLWALNAGCKTAKSWEQQGLQDLRIAINLSAQQLERSDVHLLVERMLRHHGLASHMLEFELTETLAAVDPLAAQRLFEALRALGISISIDDFGTGYSSLSYVKRLRFDKIKIDREFVTQVDRQRDSQAICQSILALARGLRVSVLAEGVERAEEYEWLRRHGCKLFQGFYFSRPIPSAAAFTAFVQDRQNIEKLTSLDATLLGEPLRKSA